jgi:hypothetical protein
MKPKWAPTRHQWRSSAFRLALGPQSPRLPPVDKMGPVGPPILFGNPRPLVPSVTHTCPSRQIDGRSIFDPTLPTLTP